MQGLLTTFETAMTAIEDIKDELHTGLMGDLEQQPGSQDYYADRAQDLEREIEIAKRAVYQLVLRD